MKHYFQTASPNLELIHKKLVMWFKEHEFDVNFADADGEFLIQARKTNTIRALMGTNQAFRVRLYLSEEPNEFVFESAIGAWTSNLTGVGISALFTGGITLLTGAAGVAWAKKTERDIVEYIETTLKFRRSKSMEIQPGANGASLPTPVPAIPPVVGAARPAPPRSAVAPPTDSPKRLSIAERVTEKSHAELQKLKDAHEAGILNDAEFASKKSDLQSKAMEWEVRFAIEDRSAKLRAALEGGILEQHEYQSKLAALEQSVREELNSQRKQAQKETQLGKLKSALDAGVLSHDEYQAKILALG